MPSSKDLVRSELLAIQYRRGAPEAMGELVLIWQDPLYYYVRRLVPDEEEALDVLQDVWVLVIRRFRQLRNPAAFPAWLFQIARSVAYGRVRKSQPQEMLTADSRASQEEGEEDSHPVLSKNSSARQSTLTAHRILVTPDRSRCPRTNGRCLSGGHPLMGVNRDHVPALRCSWDIVAEVKS